MSKKKWISAALTMTMAMGMLSGAAVTVHADDVEEITWMFWDVLG